MKTKLSCLLAFIGSSLAAFGGPRVASFAELPPGDTIFVHYSSLGCYHFDVYEFTYSPAGNGSFEVEKLRMGLSKDKRTLVETSRKRAGHVSLEKGEAAKLDALIAFYRQPPEGTSTTTDHIILVQMRDGRVVAEESFVDVSGATAVRTNLLTFRRMIVALSAIDR